MRRATSALSCRTWTEAITDQISIATTSTIRTSRARVLPAEESERGASARPPARVDGALAAPLAEYPLHVDILVSAWRGREYPPLLHLKDYAARVPGGVGRARDSSRPKAIAATSFVWLVQVVRSLLERDG